MGLQRRRGWRHVVREGTLEKGMPTLEFEEQINTSWQSHRKEKVRWTSGLGRWITLNKGTETILSSFGVLGHWSREAVVADEAGKSNLDGLRMIWSVEDCLTPHPRTSSSPIACHLREVPIDEGEAWARLLTAASPLSCVEWPWSHFLGDWDSLSRRPRSYKSCASARSKEHLPGLLILLDAEDLGLKLSKESLLEQSWLYQEIIQDR